MPSRVLPKVGPPVSTRIEPPREQRPEAGGVALGWLVWMVMGLLVCGLLMFLGPMWGQRDRDVSLGFTVLRSHHVRLLGFSAGVWGCIGYLWLCYEFIRGLVTHVPAAAAGTDRASIVEARVLRESWGRHIFSLFVTWVLVCLAFWNSFDSGWVLDNLYIIKADPRTRAQNWDDPPNEPNLRNPGVKNYFTQDYWWPKGISGLYRPLASITYWINWTVLAGEGEDLPRFKEFSLVKGFHGVNLVVHWLNAALLYALALILTRKWGLALFASALFAVHPITTESVTNIIGRADLFAAFSVLAGLLVWRWGAELPRWHKLWGLIAVMLIVAFGVFSKESAVAIGLILLIYDIAYRWNPTVAKWLGVILLVMLVPAISGASFAIGKTSEGINPTLAALIAVAVLVLAVVWHMLLLRATALVRLAGLGISLLGAVAASAFVPVTGVLLVCLLIVVEYIGGPWFKRHFPEFDRIKLAALGYTAAFVGMLVLPLGFGAWIWFKSGVAAKHSIPDEILMGPVNVLLGTWAYDVTADQSFYWVHQYIRAGLIVLVGVLVWTFFAARRFAVRAGVMAALPAILCGSAWLLSGKLRAGEDPTLVPDNATILLSAARLFVILALLVILGRRRAGDGRPWAAMPVVLILALGACYFVFWAGFVLTFIVGLIELIKRSTMPRVLRESMLWHSLVQRFVTGYYLLLPPVIALFFIRYWIFNIQSTPPETPFLDNPLRGGPFDPLPFWQSRMTAIKVMGKLMYLLFCPVYVQGSDEGWQVRNLSSCDYSWDQIPFFLDPRAPAWEHIKAIIALLIVIGLIVLACRSLRRNKPLFFFIMFFFAAMLPTSNIPVLMGSIMAERFMYLPLIGLAGALGVVLAPLVWRVLGWIRAAVAPQAQDDREARALPYLLARGFVLFGIPLVLLGFLSSRAYLRNFDWRSDVTLWEAAVRICPRAFRCYQSLAYAYFEENAAFARPFAPHVERMISTAEQARPIVDVLSDDRNSSRLYMHLGMYYCIRGEMLCLRDAAGAFHVTPQARPWFEKSIESLERAVRVDRRFNEVNRRRQIERGDKPEKIWDAGLTPIYMQLGISYHRLGRHREAYNAFNYWRQLEPESVEAYMRIARVQLDQGRLDDAATSLIQMVQLDGQRQDAWLLLAQIYASIPAGQNAMVRVPGGEGLRLNIDNPLVRDHMMLAARNFIRTFRYSRREGAAETARRIAIYRFGVPPALINPVMFEPLKRVTPNGVEDVAAAEVAGGRSARGD